MSFSREMDTSTLYGVDYKGKVWAFSSSSSSSLSGVAAWTPIPNPTKVNIKRLVSFANILWGIGSDHEIYVYVPKRDIPIRIREEIFENQRWNPVEGFTNHLLPTDRAPFSNEEGTMAKEKSDKLPSTAWQWEDGWQIENTFGNHIVAEGWTYAIDFPAAYHPEKSFKSFVKRRKLFRYRRYVAVNKWNKLEPLRKDHTEEPFIDVGVGGLNYGSSHDICCVWALSILGEVYFRCDASITNPEGSFWVNVPIRKGLEACQLSVAKNGTPFIVTWTGSFMYRMGITPKLPQGTDWVEAEGPSAGLLQLAAGTNCLWGLTRDKKCWALKGNWPEIINKADPVFEWIEIPGRMKNITIGKTDDLVLALSDEELSVLHQRVGISDDQTYGQCWKPVFVDMTWDAMSTVSTVSEDVYDGSSDSNESAVSLRPEIPQPTTLPADTIGDVGGVPNSFSWVDGACISFLRTGTENDLEVGPWRDDILHDLQKLKLEGSSFSYPDALEPSSVSWSKSSRVKFLNKSRSGKWLTGQLEISNNNHLTFHENLEKMWLCSVSDILSVFGGASAANVLSLRIRNDLEPNVAHYVNIKFSTEQEAEEWHATITDLTVRPMEEFSIAGIWLTTSNAEVVHAGQVKILDEPVDAEVVTAESDDFKFHHPLVKGFLPDSELKIDIAIPMGANRFSINLQGRTQETNIFHFNPRFPEEYVVRNTCENGNWGEEEKDGVFPFREGFSYTICLQCTPTNIMTTVIHKKTKFIFSFDHRIPPKQISNLYIYGDVTVNSVRYDPKLGESYDMQFVTQSLAGHFWKVEAASNGAVWALGYDQKVWCFTGSFKQQQKLEGNASTMNPVSDERTYYVYENQRWNPVTGFTSNVALPTDRHGWTDETGRIRMEKDDIKLPFSLWSWTTDWDIDYETSGGVDESGWQYAVDFPACYHSHRKINDFARRRRWKRVAKLTIIGPWHHVSGMKLVDLSIRMNEDCEWEVLGLQENGDPVVRVGISPECPSGSAWESLVSEKPFISISGWFGKRIWTIGKEGFAYIRYGRTWQMLDRPRDSPLKSIKVGSNSVWAIGTNNVLYRRSEVQATFPEGREWERVCDNVLQVGVAPDGSLWALLKTDGAYGCALAKRVGVSFNAACGLGWDIVAEGPWRYLSASGCFSRNK